MELYIDTLGTMDGANVEIVLLPRKDGGANPPPANSAPIQLSTVSMNNLYKHNYL